MIPEISVVIPTYNHENFVKECIQSVLDQDFQNFEIIITDDGSTDKTAEVVRKFSDERIRLYRFETNKGACESLNNCILHSSGKYIALINSDDRWHSKKLSTQYKVISENPSLGAVFTDARFIDENGLPANPKRISYRDNTFSHGNKSQSLWLKQFFTRGNCLCHPSILIKRSCYDELGLYDNRYRQLPDFDMWIRLLNRYKIHVIDQKLVDFRLLPHEANASSPSLANSNRTKGELLFILKNFFETIDINHFKEAFAEEIISPSFQTEEDFYCEKALILLRANTIYSHTARFLAYEMIFNGLRKDTKQSNAFTKYGVDERFFQNIPSQIMYFDPISHMKTKRILKATTKKIFEKLKTGLFK